MIMKCLPIPHVLKMKLRFLDPINIFVLLLTKGLIASENLLRNHEKLEK